GDLLAVKRVLVLRDHGSVGDEVIDAIEPHGAGKSEITCLNGRGPKRENARPALAGVAREINDDVDFHLANAGRNPLVIVALDVDKAVERCFETGSHCAPFFGPERERDGLETRAVVMLEDGRCQTGDRMIAEIGREITEPDLVVPIALATPQSCARLVFVMGV